MPAQRRVAASVVVCPPLGVSEMSSSKSPLLRVSGRLPPGHREITDRDRFQCLVFRITCCGMVATLTISNIVLCLLPLFLDESRGFGNLNTETPSPPEQADNATSGNQSRNSSTGSGDYWLDSGFGFFIPILFKFSDEVRCNTLQSRPLL